MGIIEDVARITTAYTMGVHALLVYWAISLPIFVFLSEYLAYKHNDKHYYTLAKRFAIVMTVLFAMGSLSGVMIAIEFATIWYKFMYLVSQVDVLPLDIEVLAFFMEVIFLSLYLYGWDKVSRRTHLILALLIGIGSMISAILITLVNSWMNTPNGFNIQYYLQTGKITDVNPLATLFPPSASAELPMLIPASYFVGFGSLLAYFAFRLLFSKNLSDDEKEYYRKGLKLALYVFAIDAIFLALGGDTAGKQLYQIQPLKLATLEYVLKTYNSSAPEIVGPFVIPGLLSLLVSWPPNINTPVLGYSSFVQQDWNPYILIAHNAFDIHTIIGIIGALLGWIIAYIVWKKPKFILKILKIDDPLNSKLILYTLLLIGGLQIVAWELGWTAAEVGRQPFIIAGPMVKTSNGLYEIQYILLTSQGYINNPNIIPIGIAIMITLTILYIGTLYALKIIFSKYDISKDLEEANKVLKS